jgi:cobalt/nickel transport system permease protein
MWAAAGGLIGYCSRKLARNDGNFTAPLMGVVGAFIFAVQMVNFSIPGTGSSGHLGGGLLLAVLLGPHAALITMASVLVIQSLFFGDGGLLALGCNILNLGFIPAFIAYLLVYKPIAGTGTDRRRLAWGSVAAAVLGLQLGALGVVLETYLSSVSLVPLGTFLLLMLPVHLAIGIVEGLVTFSILLFVRKALPELLIPNEATAPAAARPYRALAAAMLLVALCTGGIISRFASENPDGLEWSVARAGFVTAAASGVSDDIHEMVSRLRNITVLMPDYSFRRAEGEERSPVTVSGNKGDISIAGILGASASLVVAMGIGVALRRPAPKP